MGAGDRKKDPHRISVSGNAVRHDPYDHGVLQSRKTGTVYGVSDFCIVSVYVLYFGQGQSCARMACGYGKKRCISDLTASSGSLGYMQRYSRLSGSRK